MRTGRNRGRVDTSGVEHIPGRYSRAVQEMPLVPQRSASVPGARGGGSRFWGGFGVAGPRGGGQGRGGGSGGFPGRGGQGGGQGRGQGRGGLPLPRQDFGVGKR